MSEPRLKAKLWVQAVLRAADIVGRPGAVLRRGDPDAGGVILVLRGRGGLSALSQVRDGAGELAWLRATGPTPVGQADVDQYLNRQAARDPDLWIVEFEAPDLLPPFEARLLGEPKV